MPPESKSTVKEIQRKFGEAAVDRRKHKRQGEVLVLAGDYNARIGKASNPTRTLDTMGKYRRITMGQRC